MIKNKEVLLTEIKNLNAQLQEFKDKEEDRKLLNMTMEEVKAEIKEKRKYSKKA